MKPSRRIIGRWTLMSGLSAGAGFAGLPVSLHAQGLAGSSGLGSILGRASDNACGKLAALSTFSDDEDIRIGLPIVGDLACAAVVCMQR